jgi:DNA polymerase IV
VVRKIIHVDMDAFYASVEQRDDPSLRGKPLVVGGRPDSRAVVCAASYEARAYGVRSAIPCSQALRLCPEAIFVSPNFDKYRQVSQQLREIFLRHTPLVEPLSLDEAYLDVTVELTGLPTATETAVAIRRQIFDETSLTASAGVAPNKFLAKIASDWRKPDGLFVIKPHHVEKFLEPLPVRKLPGVGAATAAALERHQIRLVGDIRKHSPAELIDWFGRYGERLWELAHGIDESPVMPSRERKSLSSEETFATDLSMDQIRAFLPQLASGVAASLEKRGLKGRTVTVKLRNSTFRTATRRVTMPEPVTTAATLEASGVELLERFTFSPTDRFRLLGLGVSNFEREEEEEEGSSSER